MLRLNRSSYLHMIGHAYDALPYEGCGLLGGVFESAGASPPGTPVGTPAGTPAGTTVFYPCRNAAESARVYTVDPRDHLRADRDAEGRGLELIGVMHSHTHTAAYPSPTDVNQAPDPAWHYVIVSLAQAEPDLRSFRIVDGRITEEPVDVVPDAS